MRIAYVTNCRKRDYLAEHGIKPLYERWDYAAYTEDTKYLDCVERFFIGNNHNRWLK